METVMALAVVGVLLVPLVQLLATGLDRSRTLALSKEAEQLWPAVLVRLKTADRASLLRGLRAKKAQIYFYHFTGKTDASRTGLASRVQPSSDPAEPETSLIPAARLWFGKDLTLAKKELKAAYSGAAFVADLRWSPLNRQNRPPGGLGLLKEPRLVLQADVRRVSIPLSRESNHESAKPIFSRVFTLER